ncbi:hypothetical protein IY145_02410 [Methylosinus sp. H3A]|uniref:hypothetical protein n=1 Tax=Methylosinus sp. H3A TaxID=2785786 RepID=UPI0018C32395|nr:hypothetical protein [Methylosinus sp. H3A]MBG0808241.1 hypothetical protein [Methylosinus sp. H3A]
MAILASTQAAAPAGVIRLSLNFAMRLQMIFRGSRALASPLPPAAALVIDDQDFSLSASIFEAILRALSAIEPPWRRRALQQRGAIGLGPQLFDFRVMAHGVPSLSRVGRSGELDFPFSFPKTPSADRETAGLQGRAERAGAKRRTLVGAAGASGSHASSPFAPDSHS